MSLLDTIVDANFRSEGAGRIVIFSGDRRHRGYLVKSPAEELRIKSFLKMFYFAYFSILSLGILLSSDWSTFLNHILGRPEDHLARTLGISIGVYSLVVGLPYWLLWRSFKKAILTFVSAQDKVVVSGKGAINKRLLLVGVAVFAFAVLLMFGGLLLVRAK
jgi:hypothetical protein